ncbi:MAG: mechanosensitive ion channel domain-containing protein [Thermoanaerobaculales bacterium]|jgi:small-conductance mechanosensitive channel|nr:mechanosensitive ion channel domain-containing protein [Thermoanaerobaculales bacterium]
MWYQTFLDLLRDAFEVVWARSPAVLVAAILLVLGWITSRLLALVIRRLTQNLMSRWEHRSPSLERAMEHSGADTAAPKIAGTFVFWLSFLIFAASAAEIAGLPIMTDVLARTSAFLPNILIAAVIVLFGLVSGRLAQGATTVAVQAAGVPQGRTIGKLVHAVVLTAALVIALDQLGVNGHVLELTLVVTIGSALAAAALAFGLGARSSVANLVAARYAAQFCEIGQRIRIEQAEGTVVGLTATSVILETPEGRIVVPASRFQERSAVLVATEE